MKASPAWLLEKCELHGCVASRRVNHLGTLFHAVSPILLYLVVSCMDSIIADPESVQCRSTLIAQYDTWLALKDRRSFVR